MEYLLDVTFSRSLLVISGIIIFVGIWFWAYSSKRRRDFEEASLIPLLGDTLDESKDKAEK